MADPQQQLTECFTRAIVTAFGDAFADTDPLIRLSNNPRFGDYQANVAMGLGKQLKRKPRDVAQQIVDHLDVDQFADNVEIAGPGFINVRLDDDFLDQTITQLACDESLGVTPASPRPRVVVDYLGPNMAKEMHVGHIRSASIGDSIARVLEALGHDVIRQNHLGDWGTQFGMLLEYLIETGWQKSAGGSISDLDALYKQAQKRFEADADYADRARKRVVALQSGDEEALRHWRMLIDESVRHMNEMIARLGVCLSDKNIRPESFYNSKLPEVTAQLQAAGLVVESRGAKVIFIDGFLDREGNPLPMIVQKGDGGYLYATTDLAAAQYRLQELKADRIIYLTDARQAQHFAMVFDTVKRSNWASTDVRLDHVPFGTILGKDRKPFKTRQGGTVKLADVLDEAVRRAETVVATKNPELSAEVRHRIAEAVGIGAVKYGDLSGDRIKDYVFDWDRMLAMEGNTSPYLQNAYVRIRSIFRKGNIEPSDVAHKPIQLRQPAERALAIQLLQLPIVLAAVADTLEPHRLCTYLYELASAFHQFYEQCPVLTAPDAKTRQSRLALCDLTARTLSHGLDLLGVNVVDQM